MTLLTGWKTYFAGAGLILSGVAIFLGASIPGLEMANPIQLIMEGLGFIGLRMALT